MMRRRFLTPPSKCRAVLSGDMRCTTKHRRFLTLGPSHPIARGRAGFGLLAVKKVFEFRGYAPLLELGPERHDPSQSSKD